MVWPESRREIDAVTYFPRFLPDLLISWCQVLNFVTAKVRYEELVRRSEDSLVWMGVFLREGFR